MAGVGSKSATSAEHIFPRRSSESELAQHVDVCLQVKTMPIAQINKNT